jgi:hypothetical protein
MPNKGMHWIAAKNGLPVMPFVAEARGRASAMAGARYPAASVGLGAARLVNHGSDLANLPDSRPLRVRYQVDLPVTPAISRRDK